MNSNICIIAVGYNRPVAMERLLKSILDAEYFGDSVDLIISIDKGKRQDEIIKCAERIEWKHGKKIVRAFQEKQGLRNHIIQCGDLSQDYRAVVVLEDDLTVAKNYYNYVRSIVDYYDNDNSIAGISLYKHTFCVDSNSFFEPAYNGSDVFLMQYAQSWGECWTTRMWSDFRKWYKENEILFDNPANQRLQRFPHNITTWSPQSWLKYYIAYLIEKNLYYVYPHSSLTTNHSETGEHNQLINSDFQASLPEGIFSYRLRDSSDLIKYDAFFERVGLCVPGYENKIVVIDLYGRKRSYQGADILISTSSQRFVIMNKWMLKLRPQEVNCQIQEEGEDIFVYDLHSGVPEVKNKSKKYTRTRYDVRAKNYRALLVLGFSELKVSFATRLKRLFHL